MSLSPSAALGALVARSRRESFGAERLCFGPQAAFVRDTARYRVAVCSRRAGKTVASAVLLLERALATPKSSHVYITLSRVNAKRIVWRQLLDLNEEHALGGEPNETYLQIRFPNKATIYLSGAKDSAEVEKFRGLSLSTVVVDESQAFRGHLRTLIDDVLVPCLWDTRGVLCLIGTPGPLLVGPFYDAWIGKAWSKHAWTILDNPHIERMTGQTPHEILAEERQRRGVTEDDPTYQRESLGRWVRDERALVFAYDPARNDYDRAPVGDYRHVMGIDLGMDDSDAIAILGWKVGDKNLYLLDEHVAAGQNITELMDHVNRLREVYDPRRIVVDTGGLGKKIAEEIRKRWGVPVVAAEKTRKLEHIALLNDALRTGRMFARRGSRFAEDAALVTWDPDKRGVKISDAYHSDIADAVLYAYRAAAHFLEEPEAEKPKDDGDRYWRQLEERESKPWFERDAEDLWR